MKITYFKITPNWVEKLMPIEQACHSHPWSEKLFRSCIEGRYFGYLAQHNDQVLGFYIADSVAGESTLMDICVAPLYQGKGYGKALLEHYLQQTKSRECSALFLEVRASNLAAQMLYINNGYIETGRRTGYYPKAIGYEDAIIMCKK